MIPAGYSGAGLANLCYPAWPSYDPRDNRLYRYNLGTQFLLFISAECVSTASAVARISLPFETLTAERPEPQLLTS